MAKKKKATRPEVHITITGPQGIGKSVFAQALAEAFTAVVGRAVIIDGHLVGDHCELATAWVNLAGPMKFLGSRAPYQTSAPKIVITTSNE